MLFTTGNIITIVIVLIILALYRQLDRNNRSLDKVRRYSDKVTSEIEAFVDQKTQEMQNLAIEIDVHQKTGKEVLKRISSIEEGFRDKASEVDEINTRITGYDKSLSELVGMTGKVDENLKRLHNESEFVDKVGKRLKDAQLRLNQLESEIPRLSDDFTKVNQGELEQLKNELFSEVERQSAIVLDGIASGKDRVDDFTAHLDSLEQRRDKAAETAVRHIESSVGRALNDAEQKLAALEGEFTESMNSLVGASNKRSAELEAQLSASENRFRSHIDEIGELLNNKLVDFKDNINILEEEYQMNLKDSAEKARTLEDDVFASLKNYIDERSRDTRKQINNVFEELKKETLSYRADIDTSFGESQSQITVWRTSLGKDMDDGTNSINARIEGFETEFRQRLGEIEEESRRLVDGTKGDVFRRVEDMIQTVNEKEVSLTEFEENLAYKLTRIEEITSDIDLLEDNLKQMVGRAVDEVNGGFEEISSDMSRNWQQSNDSLQTDIQAARNVMTELESELDALKSRAYDNVSEKLRVFEDDFFDDLKARSAKMENGLVQWQGSIEEKLDTISNSSESSRLNLEEDYTTRLKHRLGELSEHTSGEFTRYENFVEGYEDIIKQKMNGIEHSIESVKTRLDEQIAEGNRSLETFLNSEVENTKAGITESINRFVRESEASMNDAVTASAAEGERIQQQVEAQSNELELWQARLQQQFSEAQNELQQQYSSVKSEASERMMELREAMNEQRNDFDNLSSDILRRSRDLQAELEQQVHGFDQKTEEINEGFNLAAKRVYDKIEEQSRELSFTIAEIDKQQKNFIAQTKIFERADSMRESLENSIADLNGEITRVTKQASQIHEAEKKFLTIKKLGEDVSSRMAEFAAEKRRIDELDSDFQRLMSISQSVDMKLNQVVSADDSLQLLQARLKELDAYQKEIEGRYERLQKKESIVDSTIQGVDRSFQQLNELDHMISTVSERSEPLNSRIDEFARRIDFLTKNKKQMDAAISHVETIDVTLRDLEGRIDRMQKAREWLAGTETRLVEVNKQAQEQVNLLGTLVNGVDSKARGEGAPPHKLRDVVIKLAHEGWTIEQISKSTKLSRGEVELILELQPKK